MGLHNGNTNDYSGNKNNGKAVNVGYSSTWLAERDVLYI